MSQSRPAEALVVRQSRAGAAWGIVGAVWGIQQVEMGPRLQIKRILIMHINNLNLLVCLKDARA